MKKKNLINSSIRCVRIREWLIKKDRIGDSMKSWISVFDWNSGEEVDPFGWLFEDKTKSVKKPKTIRIRKK